MADKLTPAQKLAVTDRGGRLLVSAAAGSGKTKVLVDRLIGHITDPAHPSNIDDFLIITYTKAAASELRAKIAKRLTQCVADAPDSRHLHRQMQRLYLAKISTVHAFCADILRENAYQLDISADFRVADERECAQLQLQVMEKLLDRVYDDVALDGDFQAFFETQGFGRDDRLVPQIILQVYQASRCHLDPEQWLEKCYTETCADGVTDASQTSWGAYLIKDLQDYLDLQIDAMSRCAQMATGTAGMEKAALLLTDTVRQLVALRNYDEWDKIVAGKDVDYGRLTFTKACTDDSLKESIKAVRDACKKHLTRKLAYFASDSAQVLQDLKSAGSAARGLIKLVRQFSDEYGRAKQMRHILDFGDLEHKMLDLVYGRRRTGPTALARQIGSRYREILVDEYQDSNAVQDTIFSALTEQRQNCFMVGDVKQSIYQFRLADPTIFLDKYSRFLPAETAEVGQGRKVLLSSNFRSAGPVIEAVNAVFSRCMSPRVGGLAYGEDEMLREGINHIPNTETEVELHAIQVERDTYAEEAAFTAERISQLLDGSHMIREGEVLRPIKPEDIVILLRSPNSVGGDFVYALERRGIRCSTGAGMDLLLTEEISTLRAILQTISNPLQDIPLIAALTSRVFLFTADDLASFRGKHRAVTIYDALKQDKSEKSVYFLNCLEQMRREAKLSSLSELIEKIFTITRIDSIFAADMDGEERTANLQLFCQLAAECEANGQKELDQFLDFLTSLEEKGLTVSGESVTAGAVTIMSIHKSKGLEFPVVFLCGLSKSFNMESTRVQVLCDRELGLGLSCVDLKNRVRYPTVAKRAIATKMIRDSISEEMRVLYVAMTRAKDRLIMTYADKDLQTHLSELIGQINISPEELLTSDVSCSGTWILLTALRRAEAGKLFALAGRPEQVYVSDIPWKIDVIDAVADDCSDAVSEVLESSCVDPVVLEKIRACLKFIYPYSGASQFPSKLTATQLKGRFKDQEAAENAGNSRPTYYHWRKPSFAGKEMSGTQYGNAVHKMMQHIRFAHCGSEAEIRNEIARLIQEQIMTSEEAEMVDIPHICEFFATEYGKKLCAASNVLREFKFSILDDASNYGCPSQGEDVLLQGVVDCAILEDDGITILDFKTDRVTQESMDSVANGYRLQVNLYARALSRIFRLPIKTAQLYFFRLNQFVKVV